MILYIYTESREDARRIWTNAVCRATRLLRSQQIPQGDALIRNGCCAFAVLDPEAIEPDTVPRLAGAFSQHIAYATAHGDLAVPWRDRHWCCQTLGETSSWRSNSWDEARLRDPGRKDSLRTKLLAVITVADAALILCILVTAFLLGWLSPKLFVFHGTEVEIREGDRVAGRYSLETDRRVEAEGPLGRTLIEIKDGHARIVSSPCPCKVCVRMGTIGREGGAIACVPNRIVVSVGKQRADGLDAVSK